MRHRHGVVALCAAVIAVAVTAVVLVLATAGGGGSGADSPAAAARQWGRATLFHQQARVRALSCPSARSGFGIYAMVFSGSGVRTGRVVAEGHDTWDVPLTTTGPLGGTTVHLKVEKRGGRYLVC
jgi:hypothetical protein